HRGRAAVLRVGPAHQHVLGVGAAPARAHGVRHVDDLRRRRVSRRHRPRARRAAQPRRRGRQTGAADALTDGEQLMDISLTLIVVMAVLFAAGVYAMLERSLTRVLIGFLLLGNATNLLLLIAMGVPGNAPFFGE